MAKIRPGDLRRPLGAAMRDQREQARKNATASKFAGSGFAVTNPNEVTLNGNLIVLGNFTASGKITNDALVSPVQPGQTFQGRNTFGVTVAGAYILQATVTVPTGFTSVIVQATGRVAATNSTASTDYLYTSLDVSGVGGSQFGNPALAGGFTTSIASYGTLRSGLTPGGTITVGLWSSTGSANWTSSASNGADLSVTYLWLR